MVSSKMLPWLTTAIALIALGHSWVSGYVAERDQEASNAALVAAHAAQTREFRSQVAQIMTYASRFEERMATMEAQIARESGQIEANKTRIDLMSQFMVYRLGPQAARPLHNPDHPQSPWSGAPFPGP